MEKAGFRIDTQNNFLGASTDGYVSIFVQGKESTKGQKTLLEIKNLLKSKKIMLREVARMKLKNYCVELNQEGTLQLKRNHAYYIQCIGQSHVYQVPWLDAVVRCNNNNISLLEPHLMKKASLLTPILQPSCRLPSRSRFSV